MARRGRGSTARTKAAPNGRALNGGAPDPGEPGDEPGARTIGALALKRWAARGPGRGDASDDGGDVVPTIGPFDEDDAPHDAVERVDFGAVRVPVPFGGEVSVEPEDGRLQAVHVMLPAGRLSVSALAAPRTERLWPDLAAEIDESLREGGATVRSFTGEWGRELHARTGDASSLFVGVDGPRWMLYGVATGPTSAAAELDAALRTMLRGTVVVRGRSPYPVRTVLPLTVPDELPRPGIAPDRVPVPRMPAERAAAPVRQPIVDAPTMITKLVDGSAHLDDTVPHGIAQVPGPPARNGSVRPAAAAAAGSEGAGDAGNGDPGNSDPGNTETAVSRTASRGLFRRRPERPAARRPQRRVAELLAEAERDRTAAARGDSAPRPERPAPAADEPGRAAPGSAPFEPPFGPPRPEHRPVHDEVGGPWTNGSRTEGYVPRELTVGEPLDGPRANGSYGSGGPFDEPPVNGAYGGGSPFDVPRANGSHGVPGGHGDELSGPPWPSAGNPDPWSSDFGAGGAVLPGRSLGHEPPDDLEYGFGVDRPEFGSVDDDVEATVWASMIRGEPHPSSGIAADGSDDWTLPLPVVRPEPEPDPEPGRPPARQAPRSRRARREAEERHGERGTGRRVPGEWPPQEWAPEEGAHSADRPRHGGLDRGPERSHAADDRPTRASRRNGQAHARHADDDLGSHADRARHRRPDR